MSDQPSALFRIDIQSIGTADAGIIRALRKFDPRSPQLLAEIVYQAPSTFIENLDSETAHQIKPLLMEIGLDVSVESMQKPRLIGKGDYEIAICISDHKQVPLIAKEVAAILGVSMQNALNLVCSFPSVIMGNVSMATVNAIRKRLAPFGVTLDVAIPKESTYDLLLVIKSFQCRQTILDAVAKCPDAKAFMEEGTSTDGAETILVYGLSHKEVQTLLHDTEKYTQSHKVCNQAFERFDVRLNSAQDCQLDDLKNVLREEIKIPDQHIEKVIEGLPVVLMQNVTREDSARVLPALTACNAEAEALSLAFWSVSLEIQSIQYRDELLEVLGMLESIDQAQINKVIASNGGRIDTRMARVGTQWLQSELGRVGTASEII